MSTDDDPHDVPRAEIQLTDVPTTAGGMGAMVSTLKHLSRDTGIVRGTKALLAMNQPDGFDCPGCAWPEPGAKHRPHIEFCENGAKALAEEATTARATPALFAAASIDELRKLSDFELGQLGRLTHPMVLEGRHYVQTTWDEAFALLARELRAAGPASSALYTSGRTSNEAAFLYQLVGRMFGTNNFPDCSNMCHESSGVALNEAVGVGKGSVSLDDFAHCDLIFVVGQNPGTNHPRMLSTLREAAKRGATIVSINPLREVGLSRFAHPQRPLDLLHGVTLAKHFVQVQIGGDQAFFLGIGKAVLERDAVDHEFLAAHTTGFEAWRAHAEATPWAAIVESSGIDEAQIRAIADLYVDARSVIACWAMGLTQHKHSVVTIQEIVNVMLLRGNVGRRGAGLCPVRGHSNVQGDRTMGIDHVPPARFLDALGETFGFTPPRTPGLDTVETIHAMEHGDVRVFVALGGNFLSATPDTDRTARALERCTLTASVSTKLNRTHLYPGARALILPCLARSERDEQPAGRQFVTVEDSMSMVHRSQGVLAPASEELRSEPWIVAGLGRALLGDAVAWTDLAADYDRIRDLIARVVPGFTDFNTRVRTPDGFQLPNVARDRSFASIGGRARFTVATLPDLALPPGRLRMMTIRSHDQYNTTVYGLDDRYRGIRGERRVVFLNREDMTAHHLEERQLVDLNSEWTDGERVAESFIVVPYDLPRRCAATYFPEANALVPLGSVADRSNTPTSKSVVIRIRARATR
ncbi:MAG: FdhF/YdeP family oxidoreductase [Kofleriaceae bacterium]|nr:FdhF/YdeP family oxidoreductase [Kofleriaceae bacterium]